MHVAVSAVGTDRPGIVAAVSRVLYEHGGNIEDSRMALLGGHFAMMLIVSLPVGANAAGLAQALDEATTGMHLSTRVESVSETAAAHAEGAPYVLSVYGADRPGIVAEVTGALARAGANITDLATHVADGSVYIMVMEVRLPPGADPDAIEAAVREAGSGVDISFHAIEAETL